MVRISFFTCVFLIGLRLVIGWHFFFEGIDKYESLKNEGAETSKPFSSAGYFAEAEGPLGPSIRELIGDPDDVALAKITLVESSDEKPATKMPPALAAVWDDYARQFEAFYHLGDEQKGAVDEKLRQAKTNYVLWLTDKLPPAKDDKGKTDGEDDPRKSWIIGATVGEPAIIYRPEAGAPERIAAYKRFIEKVRADYKELLPKMGKDVEQVRLRTLKNKTAEARADLMKSVDEHTKKMKESLAKLVDGKLAAVDFGPPDDPKIDERVLAMLTLAGTGDASSDSLPTALNTQWDDFAAYVRANLANGDAAQRIDTALQQAKLRYVRFLLDLDMFTGAEKKEKSVKARLDDYRQRVAKLESARTADSEQKNKESKAAVDAAAKNVIPPRQEFIDDIKLHTDVMRQIVGAFKSEKGKDKDYDTSKGIVDAEKPQLRFLWRDWPTTKLQWLDWSTRWGLLVAGGCLLVGLFTRLACFYCICFLAVEVLSNTSLPWLPSSPKSEGHYTFVNKNVVELFALLTLMTLPTGRWFGLDAIVSRLWPFRRRRQNSNT